VKRINKALREANLDYLGDREGIDERDTYVRRYFSNGSFGSGGRLFGGFWLNGLKKQDRIDNVLIDGERVVSLDFKAMLPTLAYAHVNAVAPPGDLYAMPLAMPRDNIKVLLSACLFAEKRLGNWPEDLKPPPGVKLSDALKVIVTSHPGLAPMLFKGLGLTLMFMESEILIDALLQLLDKDIIALPVHDCLIVGESNVEAAHAAMVNAFAFHCHDRVPQISIERPTVLNPLEIEHV
jgi:hypothetical protein